MLTGKRKFVPDRLLPLVFYCITALVVLAAGHKIFYRSKHLNFYYHYLLNWEKTITTAVTRDVRFPAFLPGQHAQYMEKLIKQFSDHSIDIPFSNTDHPYIYVLSKKKEVVKQQAFLLCFEHKIIIYGLPKKIFIKLDKIIDGKPQKNQGKFKGKLQKDKKHYAGIWEI